MGKYHKLLNIPHKIIRDDFVPPQLVVTPTESNPEYVSKHQFTYYPSKVLTKECLDFLRDQGMNVYSIEVFHYNSKLKRTALHADGGGEFYPAINFIVTEGKYIVRWFDLNEGIDKNIVLSQVGTNYSKYKPNEVHQVDESDDKGPYLCNVSVPHQATIFTDDERWTYSIRFHIDGADTWEEVVEATKHLFVDSRS